MCFNITDCSSQRILKITCYILHFIYKYILFSVQVFYLAITCITMMSQLISHRASFISDCNAPEIKEIAQCSSKLQDDLLRQLLKCKLIVFSFNNFESFIVDYLNIYCYFRNYHCQVIFLMN